MVSRNMSVMIPAEYKQYVQNAPNSVASIHVNHAVNANAPMMMRVVAVRPIFAHPCHTSLNQIMLKMVTYPIKPACATES